MSTETRERCPGCGQGYLYDVGHTGSGVYRYCFMCQRGFSVPDEGELPTPAGGADHGPTVIQPTDAQAAARQADTDPEQAAARAGDTPGGGQ